jgi:hypothetical protein
LSEESIRQSLAERRLRLAFLAGAITDGLALLPMLLPPMARLLWSFDSPGAEYYFAIRYAASLMFGWTLLLLWAYQRPIERRFVAVLTLIVIAGLAITQIGVVASGHISLVRMLPSWAIQAILVYLFSTAYIAATKV